MVLSLYVRPLVTGLKGKVIAKWIAYWPWTWSLGAISSSASFETRPAGAALNERSPLMESPISTDQAGGSRKFSNSHNGSMRLKWHSPKSASLPSSGNTWQDYTVRYTMWCILREAGHMWHGALSLQMSQPGFLFCWIIFMRWRMKVWRAII